MKSPKISVFFFSIFLWCLNIQLLSAEIKLPAIISDGLVLQRNANVNIWGWASSGESIIINFNQTTYKVIADVDGNWLITLNNLKAGGPYIMTISGTNTITLNNVLVGDVWLCSGQSNMEISMQRVKPLYEDDIKTADNPKIHYIEIPKNYNFKEPQYDIETANWQEVNQENILQFSAVAYFFAEELNKTYNVPIGIINSSLGGAPAESWLSEDALKEFPHYYDELQKFKNDDLIKEIENYDNQNWKEWHYELYNKDLGNKNTPWYSENLDTSDWDDMEVPGYWDKEKIGGKNGVVWFRKDIEIPKSMLNKTLKLNLGRVVDSDSVYVNGTFVGTTGYKYPPRRYTIPDNLLIEGKNNITIRVINESGDGGFYLDKPYEIKSDEKTIDLKGTWMYKLGAEMPPKEEQTFIRWKPTGLFNAMIHPILNYTIKGAIWYQGEANIKNPIEYQTLLPALINNWREKFDQGDFPFLFVQLPNYNKAKEYPTESNWAELREAQLKALSVQNTAMAITIELGEWNDIHPLNKKDVAKRLVLAARKIAYKEKNIVFSGPTLKNKKIKGDKIILKFENIGSGLVAKDGELKEFAIAGSDQKFVWAKAVIKKNKIIVSSEAVKNPVAVRYAWADNPDEANLYNKEDLPASPFRTDNW